MAPVFISGSIYLLMTFHLSRSVIIYSSVAVLLALSFAFVAFNTKGSFRLASISSASCSLQSEIEEKVALRLRMETDLSKLKTEKIALEQKNLPKAKLDLASTTSAISLADKAVLSDYAMSAQKKTVDDFFEKYTAEKSIADISASIKDYTAKRTALTAQLADAKKAKNIAKMGELSSALTYASNQITALTAEYNRLLSDYKAKFKASPGNWPMTEKSYRTLSDAYNTLLLKNNAAKDKLMTLKENKASLEVLVASLPLKIEEAGRSISNLEEFISKLATAEKNRIACPSTETACDDKAEEGALIDNDRDGKANCDDIDCYFSPACGYEQVENEEEPKTGEIEKELPPVDDSGSTIVNVVDDASAEICNDGADNDGDGAADCADADCSEAENCKGNSYCPSPDSVLPAEPPKPDKPYFRDTFLRDPPFISCADLKESVEYTQRAVTRQEKYIDELKDEVNNSLPDYIRKLKDYKKSLLKLEGLSTSECKAGVSEEINRVHKTLLEEEQRLENEQATLEDEERFLIKDKNEALYWQQKWDAKCGA